MRIYTCDEPETRVVCGEVDVTDKNEMVRVKALADEMATLMYDTNGCGIAATQVGQDKRFVVVDCEWDAETGENKNPRLLVNPVIVDASDETEAAVEGCLSVPGVNIVVERSSSVVFGYIDEGGAYREESTDGLLARCVQHEIDHLDGITIVEKTSGMKRMKTLAMLEAARRQGAAPGSEAVYIVK